MEKGWRPGPAEAIEANAPRMAAANIGSQPVDAVEEVWHGLEAPYRPLFDWLLQGAPRPQTNAGGAFLPPMLAGQYEEDHRTLMQAQVVRDGAVVFVGNAAERLAQARRGAVLETRPGARPAVQERAAPDIEWVARLGAVADPAGSPARPLYLREVNVTLQDKARLQRV